MAVSATAEATESSSGRALTLTSRRVQSGRTKNGRENLLRYIHFLPFSRRNGSHPLGVHVISSMNPDGREKTTKMRHFDVNEQQKMNESS